MSEPIIKLEDICKSFGSRTLFKDLNLAVNAGEFLTIVGRSGEGKSVLLKQIIGLIKPNSGAIYIKGREITHLSGKALDSVYSTCGYVFQFAALLDSLTVFENVGITALEEGEPSDQVREKAIQKLFDVGLSEDTLSKYPSELSGGMKKRVGLARTLMLKPQIILYDEPTTGLDPISVRIIHELIKSTQKKFNVTTVVISHDIEIFKYADRVAMLHEGRIIYIGEAATIWDCDNPYVHQFIRGDIKGPITQPGTTNSP